jgi:predicted CoA-binding protein
MTDRAPTGATAGADEARSVLARSHSVLLIDWPSRDVPATLAAAGFTVIVKGGPGPTDYNVWESSDGEIVTRRLGHAPDQADLVYCHRPFGELPSIVAMAQGLGATAVWRQSGLACEGIKALDGCWLPAAESAQGRDLAAAAGLAYIDDIYIADAVRTTSAGPAEST